MKISVIDIAIAALLLLCGLIGLIRGFKMKRINFFLFATSLFIGFVAGVPLGRVIMNTSFGYDTIQNAYVSIIPNSDIMSEKMSGMSDQAILQIENGLAELKIPSFFNGLFTSNVLDMTVDVKNALASSFAFLSISAVLVFLIWLIIFILLRCLIKPVWKTLFGEKGKSFMGRLAGLFSGLVKATIIIMICMSILSFVDEMMLKFDNDIVDRWLTHQLSLNDNEQFNIGKFFYNSTSWFFSWISSLKGK